MANDEIADLGPTSQCSGGEEDLEPCYGDGTSKAGMACYIDAADGKAKAVDGDSATAGKAFVGIGVRHPTIALGTAITAGANWNLMVPKSGRIYRVFMEDPVATGVKGAPITFGQTTAGSFKVVATKASTGNITPTTALTGDAQDIVEEPRVAKLHKAMASGDTVGYIKWD